MVLHFLSVHTNTHLQLPTNTAAPWHLALCWQATKAVGAVTFNGNPFQKPHLNPLTHRRNLRSRMPQMQLQLEYMYMGRATTPTQMASPAKALIANLLTAINVSTVSSCIKMMQLRGLLAICTRLAVESICTGLTGRKLIVSVRAVCPFWLITAIILTVPKIASKYLSLESPTSFHVQTDHKWLWA